MSEYLTGDRGMDALIPTALDMIAAVREMDEGKMGELMHHASNMVEAMGQDPGVAGWLMVGLLAAMVPYEESPEKLLRWYGISEERMPKLLAAGFDRTTAAFVIDQQAREEGER